MQVKKRAKSVSFGKKEKKPEEKVTSDVVKEILENAAASNEVEDEKSNATSESTSNVADAKSAEANVADREDIKDIKESEASLEEEKPEEARVEVEKSVVEAVSVSEEKPSEKIEEVKIEEPKKEEASDVLASSFFAKAPKRRASGGNNILYFFGVAFVSFLLGLGAMAGVFYGSKTLPKIDFEMDLLSLSKPTATPTPEPTATPTEKPVDLEAYSIQVLNGSGITGKAAKLKASLTDAGFTVSTTGNADLDDYTKTQIRAKKNVSEDYLKKLEAELKKDYVLDSNPGLSPTGTDDVIVIIGSESAK